MKKRSARKAGWTRPYEPWILEGLVCPGRNWDEKLASEVRSSFKACNPNQALKMALERLKGAGNRCKKSIRASKLRLKSVTLMNGKMAFRLQQRFCNNSILFATNPNLVFERIEIEA